MAKVSAGELNNYIPESLMHLALAGASPEAVDKTPVHGFPT
jgi:hypothetical protein